MERLGKPGDVARQRVLNRELEDFKGCSDLAQQIVIDKPRFWEYKLTTELLRSDLKPILARWHSLNRNLYAKPLTRIPANEFTEWFQAMMTELQNFVEAASGIVNVEIKTSWGLEGVPGSEIDILRTCKLFTEACQRILNWEETVRFVTVPPHFKPAQECLVGIEGRLVEKLAVIPMELGKIFEQEEPKGIYKTHIDFDLPDGWSKRIHEAMQYAVQNAPS